MALLRHLFFLSSVILAPWLGIGLSLVAANGSPTGGVLADDSVHIPPQDDCLAKMGNWSEPEKWAWQQICSRERIDFDTLYGKPRDIDDIANDGHRLLSAKFFRQILEDPRFEPYTKSAAVDIVGAFLPSLQVGNASVGFLRLTNCKIGGEIDLYSVTILIRIYFSEATLGNVNLRLIHGGNINFNTSTMNDVRIQQLSITRLSFVGGRFKSLAVRISRFSEQLAILSSEAQKEITLDDVKSDGLFVEPASAKTIDINDYVDTGMFFLAVSEWLPELRT